MVMCANCEIDNFNFRPKTFSESDDRKRALKIEIPNKEKEYFTLLKSYNPKIPQLNKYGSPNVQ